MSQQIIKTGTIPNDRSGDSLFAAFNKVNANFTELYDITGGSLPDLKELIQDTIAEMIANGTLFGLTATYNDPNNALDLHVTDALLDGGIASIVFDELSFDGGDANTTTFTDMLINGGAA
jgi:hypothetical protein